MTDWAYVRKSGEYRMGRLATLRPDEEPDDDMLKPGELHARALGIESAEKSYRSNKHRRVTRNIPHIHEGR